MVEDNKEYKGLTYKDLENLIIDLDKAQRMERVDSIVRDIIDVIAFIRITPETTQSLIDIIEDDTITDKKSAIVTLLGLKYINEREVAKVLAGYGLK